MANSNQSPNVLVGTRIGRRSFITTLAASSATAVFGRDYGSQAQPVRYPDPDILVIDKRFSKYKLGNTPILRLHTGTLWAEGPAWNGVGRYLLWSDIPNDVQLRWLEEDGHVSTFRKPSGNSNGNTFDYQGRQIACQHGNRRVVRYEHDGTSTVLADQWQGQPLNAPNDAVVHPDDGAVWFTDPGYGSLMNYEGNKGELQIKEAVYRVDVKTGKMDMVTDEIFKPNGLCFSPEYKKLYVAETGASHYDQAPRNIKVWDVEDSRKLVNEREFTQWEWMGRQGSPTASELTSTGISGPVLAGSERVTTVCTSSRPTGTGSARLGYRKSALMCVSGVGSATVSL